MKTNSAWKNSFLILHEGDFQKSGLICTSQSPVAQQTRDNKGTTALNPLQSGSPMANKKPSPASKAETKHEPSINKIALEEHFSIRELLPTSEELEFFDPQVLGAIEPLLPELAEQGQANMGSTNVQTG